MKWERNLLRTYSATPFSEASVFCVVIYYLIFAIPFYLSFGTESFWMKEIRDVHVVQNSYAGSYVASVTLSNGSNLHISNIPDLFPIVDQITLQIEGTTFSNKNTFKGSITNSPVNVASIDLLLFFDTSIKSLSKSFVSTVRTSIDFQRGNSATVMGSLGLNLKQPLTLFSSSSSNQPPYILNGVFVSGYPQLVSNVGKNPELSGNSNTIYSQGTTPSFKLNLFSQGINEVRYYPSFTQTLRNAFSQYLSVLLVTLLLGRQLLKYLASHKVFPLQIEEREFTSLSRIRG